MDLPNRSGGPLTRARLIEAAGEIFAEKGLHGALIRDITRRAGANIASVNYYFRDKFELYYLVLRQAHEGIIAALNQPLSPGPPEGRVRQMLSAMLRASLDPARPRWHTLLLGRELLQPTPALDLLHDLMRGPTERLQAAVREIRPDFSDQQLMLTVSSIVAQCVFYIHHRHIARRIFPTVPEPDIDTLVDHVVDFSLGGLRAVRTEQGHTRPRRPGAAQPPAAPGAKLARRKPRRKPG